MSKTSLLPEREYIAILQLVVPMVEAKQSRALTPGDFDGKAYAVELIEAFAAQRQEPEAVAEPEVPPVVEPEPEPEEEPAVRMTATEALSTLSNKAEEDVAHLPDAYPTDELASLKDETE